MIRKKGEILTLELISWVILITGFILVAGFLLIFWDKDNASYDVCHASVLGRGSFFESGKDNVPLECVTKKICISEDGGCEESFAGEEFKKVNVKENNIVDKSEEIFADEMLRCWEMMGEGKLDIFGSWADSNLGIARTTCFICDRIAYDVSGESFSKLSEIDLNSYLEENEVKNGQNYWEALTDESVRKKPEVKIDEIFDKDGVKIIKENINVEMINDLEKNDRLVKLNNDKELAIVFMQIKSQGYAETFEKLAETGALTLGSAFALPAGRNIIGAGVSLAFLGPGFILGLVGVGGGAIFVSSNVYAGQEAAAGYCGNVNSKNDYAKEGCSFVQVMPYDAKAINQLCSHIDGRPR